MSVLVKKNGEKCIRKKNNQSINNDAAKKQVVNLPIQNCPNQISKQLQLL